MKTRRHHNNEGLRATKRGKRPVEVGAMAARLKAHPPEVNRITTTAVINKLLELRDEGKFGHGLSRTEA